MLVKCVLPVTLQPGLGRVTSTQDLGGHHLHKSMYLQNAWTKEYIKLEIHSRLTLRI